MSNWTNFGIASPKATSTAIHRDTTPGPMDSALRCQLQEPSEAGQEQHRRDAEDAHAFRAAQEDGLVLQKLPVGDIRSDDLPRDRLQLEILSRSDEMEELKASILERGQKEPIEVYIGPDGAYQLKKGWRRLTALRQLQSETGDAAFAKVIARVEVGQGNRLARYIDMVEENVVREDLSFAEMAQVAIAASLDPAVEEGDPNELVNHLYAALHKTKRSYIKGFIFMMTVLGNSLKFPKTISRNLGIEVSRAITSKAEVERLRLKLEAAATAEAQNELLAAFVKDAREAPASDEESKTLNRTIEFHIGTIRVTAREGACRIVSDRDFSALPKSALERAVMAFEVALEPQPRVRGLEQRQGVTHG